MYKLLEITDICTPAHPTLSIIYIYSSKFLNITPTDYALIFSTCRTSRTCLHALHMGRLSTESMKNPSSPKSRPHSYRQYSLFPPTWGDREDGRDDTLQTKHPDGCHVFPMALRTSSKTGLRHLAHLGAYLFS